VVDAGAVVDVVDDEVDEVELLLEELELELLLDEDEDDELLLLEDELLLDEDEEELLLEELEPVEDVVAALTATVSIALDAPGTSGFGVDAVLTVPGQQWNGVLIAPLIFGSRISGAAPWSVALGVVRLAGAMFCSAKTTFPPVGVHVVSPNGIGTLRAPARSVPVRAGSGVELGGLEMAVYT
jgi:hypothetical protein